MHVDGAGGEAEEQRALVVVTGAAGPRMAGVCVLSERAARRKERRRGWRTQDAVQNSNRWCGKHATTIFRGVNAAFVVCVALGVARCAQSGPCIGRSSCVR